ncbi:MAG: dimethylsulfonioproprionate lyase family protein [Paracoccaceae bacterium]
MNHPVFAELIEAARDAHKRLPQLAAFCDFPDDLTEAPVVQRHFPCAQLMEADPVLHDPAMDPLAKAFLAGSPHAHWRDTYAGTDIGQDFMDRFGCYCLIGPGGAYRSKQMLGFVVYMPAKLWYPWHHHPAEELYTVLHGEAEFLREGEPSETLQAGESSFHASNQPHAMETHDHPVVAYVIWRNRFETDPALTERDIAAQ